MSKAQIRELNGYRCIYLPNHPKSMKSENWDGYIYEHIVIAEKYLGRELKDNEVVHHMNTDKSDNRTENLLVLENSQHIKLHMWIDKNCPINNINSHKNEFCLECSLTLQEKQEKYCSLECYSKNRNKVPHPSKEELEKLVWEQPTSDLAKIFGVSDVAIAKWCKKYGIEKPSRGYWMKNSK